eukprot:1700372-Alexandrium_andersonii.AAC.1
MLCPPVPFRALPPGGRGPEAWACPVQGRLEGAARGPVRSVAGQADGHAPLAPAGRRRLAPPGGGRIMDRGLPCASPSLRGPSL